MSYRMLDYSDDSEAEINIFHRRVKNLKKPLRSRISENHKHENLATIFAGTPCAIPLDSESKEVRFGLAEKSMYERYVKMNNFFSNEMSGPSALKFGLKPNFGGQGPTPKAFNHILSDDSDSFFKSMTTVVLLAQYFAVLPVSTIRGPSYKSIKFQWFHYKILYWAASLLGTLFYFACYLRYSLLTGIYTKAASRLIFFASAILSSLFMLHFARNWKNLNEEFATVEEKFKKYGYPRKIGLKFKVLTIVFISCSLVEFLLSKFTFFDKKVCNDHKKPDLSTMLDSFFLDNYKEVFEFYSYNVVAGFLMLASNFRTFTVWTFQDLFLAFISSSIAERFKQIHSILEAAHGLDMPVAFWKEMREDYNNLSVLTKRVDAFTQKIMLLAIGNDLFLLCMTLFNSLQHHISSLKLACFIWSFGFQLVRTTFVAFAAAQINDESKEPKSVLYSVPPSNYTTEVRRFLTQLTTNEVALTGCGFFSVTRNLLLTIMGTVITYEIVLVQFNKNEGLETRNNQTCLPFLE